MEGIALKKVSFITVPYNFPLCPTVYSAPPAMAVLAIFPPEEIVSVHFCQSAHRGKNALHRYAKK